MPNTFRENAKTGSAGHWRKPRMKIYEYNEDLGGNYYQPMLQYINAKNTLGPYFKKKPVDLPMGPEVVSNKFTNMRYNDKTPLNLDIKNFLQNSYRQQANDLNSSTAMARITMTRASVSTRPSAHSPLDNVSTPYNPIRLLKGAPPGQGLVNHYTSELQICKKHHDRQEGKNRKHIFGIEAFDEYDYHHNLFDGPVNRDKKFWDPEKISGYLKKI